MNDIISTKTDDRFHNYSNKITKLLDMKLHSSYKKHLRQGYHNGTYIVFEKADWHTAAIRFPGATRGHIGFDDNHIITEIVLYDDKDSVDLIYKKEVIRELKKFIGMKLIRPEGLDNND